MTSTVTREDVTTQNARPSLEVIRELEQTLFREARYLDTEGFDDWLGMLAEDIDYFMPGMETRYRDDAADPYDRTRMAYYNDDLETLMIRVARLKTGTAWSEDPPTRYCHIITNIEVEVTDDPNEYKVYSNFYAYRNRNERDEDRPLVGSREDTWRYENGDYVLAKRIITPKWNVLLAKNLNIFL